MQAQFSHLLFSKFINFSSTNLAYFFGFDNLFRDELTFFFSLAFATCLQ